MYKKYVFIIFCTLLFNFICAENENLSNWKINKLIKPTERKPAKIAVLIISPQKFSNANPVEKRWALGKKVWEQYMNKIPNIDCFFIRCTPNKLNDQTSVWIEGNTIFVANPWTKQTGKDAILLKTIKAIEFLIKNKNYSHFIRTNINTFFNLKNLNNYCEIHHNSFFSTPTWQNEWYTVGYSIFFTSDVANHIVKEYKRLNALNEKLIDPYHSDDCAITALATGIWPLSKPNPFRCCPNLKPGVKQLFCNRSLKENFTTYGMLMTKLNSLKQAINIIEKKSGSNVIYFRTRDGLNIDELELFYKYMLEKLYKN